VTLTDFQKELCTTSRWDFSDLRALFVNWVGGCPRRLGVGATTSMWMPGSLQTR
jgi:hypothetical protein